METFSRQGRIWTAWRTLLAGGAGLLAMTAPAAAGELRVVLDASAAVRSDGNYAQSELLEDEGEESLARTGFDLRLSYQMPRLTLAMGYSPSYEWVLGNADVNGTNHRLDFGLAGNLTQRLSLSVRERLLASSNLDLDTPFGEPETVAVTRRGDQLRHSLDVGLTQSLTRRVSLSLGADHTLRKFESDIPGVRDTETLGADLGVGFRMSPLRSVDASAAMGYYDFGGGRETDVQTVGVGFQQELGRLSRFRVEAGAFNVDSTRLVLVPGPEEPPAGPVDPTIPVVLEEVDESHTGWRGAISLSRQLQLFNWSLGYRHDVSSGAGLGRATEVDNAFAGASTQIGRNLVLGVDGNYSRHQDLADDDPGAGEAPEDPDFGRRGGDLAEFAAGTVRATWRFSPVARLTGGYSKIWQESRVEPFEDLSYSRFFLGLGLQLYRSGEEPQDPAYLGETEDDEPDAQ